MDQYLIYLRKSRKDQDIEEATGVQDTLERHRKALLALAEKKHLFIAEIFEEVVSGDTISERPEMQRLLSYVETGNYSGVLVMEVPRLARGNTRDQGIVSETFTYSGTKIVTPDKIYDPSNEADEEYFEFGLFMSRREYKTINRRLQRGRMASLNEGKYIAGAAPYGYEKVKLEHQKGYSLRIVTEQADAVLRIFRYYTVGAQLPGGELRPIGSYTIAKLLNESFTPAPAGTEWSASSIRDILKNPVYAGYVRWSYRPLVKRVQNGEVMHSCPVNQDSTVVKGIHEPIISEETWSIAQKTLRERSNAPVPIRSRLSNPLAGLVFCSRCGRSMLQLPRGSTQGPTLTCPTPGCATVGSRLDIVETAILDSLRLWLSNYELTGDSMDRALQTDALHECEQTISRLTATISQLENQRNKLYEFLETEVYTKEIFLDRSRTLAEKMDSVQQSLLSAQNDLKKQRSITDNSNLVPKIKTLLSVYETVTDAFEKNRMLKGVLEKVVYNKSVGGRYVESDMSVLIFPRFHMPLSIDPIR